LDYSDVQKFIGTERYGAHKERRFRAQDEQEIKKNLISANLPQNAKSVIPETILIGNPASNTPELWIPDKDVRG